MKHLGHGRCVDVGEALLRADVGVAVQDTGGDDKQVDVVIRGAVGCHGLDGDLAGEVDAGGA